MQTISSVGFNTAVSMGCEREAEAVIDSGVRIERKLGVRGHCAKRLCQRVYQPLVVRVLMKTYTEHDIGLVVYDDQSLGGSS
jgi:hypothetical protein